MGILEMEWFFGENIYRTDPALTPSEDFPVDFPASKFSDLSIKDGKIIDPVFWFYVKSQGCKHIVIIT